MENLKDALKPKLVVAMAFAEEQVRNLVLERADYFPVYTVGGKWGQEGEIFTNWCDGFLGGMMWIFYDRTGDPWWRQQAEHYSRLIEQRKTDTTMHDLGFLFWSSWKRWYDVTCDDAINAVIIDAGQTMAGRFMDKGSYFHSYLSPESLLIDIMMNVGIVFYAGQLTGDDELTRKAHQHCLTTRQCLVRGDGSTAHEGVFDLQTGEFLRQTTLQGYRGDSTWARGLCWAMYGFGTAYWLTNTYPYLQTARMCADYYLEHTPFNFNAPGGPGIPPNDFTDPREPVLYDSSAAAIAASGLINLSRLVEDPVHGARYLQAALNILNTLTGPEYLADHTPEWEGILKHGVYHRDRGVGVDESVIWGEYFFLEALDKAIKVIERER